MSSSAPAPLPPLRPHPLPPPAPPAPPPSRPARLAGLDFDVFSEFDTTWEDDSFSHEFGYEKCGHDEIDTIEPISLADPDDPRLFVTEELRQRHPTRNRRHKKRIRQWLHKIETELAALDESRFWNSRQLDRALWDARN